MSIKQRYIFGNIPGWGWGVGGGLSTQTTSVSIYIHCRGFQGAVSDLLPFIPALDPLKDFVLSRVYNENKQLSKLKRYTSLFKKFYVELF